MASRLKFVGTVAENIYKLEKCKILVQENVGLIEFDQNGIFPTVIQLQKE